MKKNILILPLLMSLLLACDIISKGYDERWSALTPSTIVFADGASVTKIMGNPVYTNAVSGVGTGAIKYTSDTTSTATVNPSTGEVVLIAIGTTVITATRASDGIYASAANTYTLTVLGIGSAYKGGKIAYILQNGDPDYDSNEPHGLIAAINDQGMSIPWSNDFTVLGTGTALGTGSANTDKIIAQNGAGSTAARSARVYNGGGYSDWYLPSKDELNKLYLNKASIGGFSNWDEYWSSSEIDSDYAWLQVFSAGSQTSAFKDDLFRVRAVRAF